MGKEKLLRMAFWGTFHAIENAQKLIESRAYTCISCQQKRNRYQGEPRWMTVATTGGLAQGNVCPDCQRKGI